MSSVIDHYDRNAAELAARYSALEFDTVHRLMRPYIPLPPSAALDIGSGSGRDAVALANLGLRVTAVEPAPAMLREARIRAANSEVEWIEDSLPALRKLAARGPCYSFILCSAVLMHISPANLHPALLAMKHLLKPSGHIGLTVRPGWTNDAPGLFYDHSADDVIDAAKRIGLEVILSVIDADHLDRPGLAWRTLVLAYAKAPGLVE